MEWIKSATLTLGIEGCGSPLLTAEWSHASHTSHTRHTTHASSHTCKQIRRKGWQLLSHQVLMKVMSLNNSFWYKMYKLTARTCLNWQRKTFKIKLWIRRTLMPIPLTHFSHPHPDSRKQNIKENVPSINSSWIMLIYPLFWQVYVIDLNNFADKNKPYIDRNKILKHSSISLFGLINEVLSKQKLYLKRWMHFFTITSWKGVKG